MSGVANATVAFTERPIRLPSDVPTSLFVSTAFTPKNENLGGEDSFYTTAPNAALACVSSTSGVSRVVMELYAPVLIDDDITFDVNIIHPSGAETSNFECDMFAVHASSHTSHTHTHTHTHILSLSLTSHTILLPRMTTHMCSFV